MLWFGKIHEKLNLQLTKDQRKVEVNESDFKKCKLARNNVIFKKIAKFFNCKMKKNFQKNNKW